MDTTAENPPPIEELRDFEDDMLKVIQSVKFKQFKQVNNPPFSKNTSTNIGNKFLALVDEHFPKDHKLRKIFNRNTIKISYSCMNDTKQIIDNHNKRILTASIQTDDTAAAAIINKELKKARFWETDDNRKWAVFSFNLYSHNHIYITKYLFSIRDD